MEEVKMKAVIRLTPDLPDDVDKERISKAITNFVLTEDAINYLIAIDYPTKTFLTDDMTIELPEEFDFKKYEYGIILRKHLVGTTKTSYTQVTGGGEESNKITYKHGLMIESTRSAITLGCTVEEKNKYYPYLEDYYKGGDKWKELVEEIK